MSEALKERLRHAPSPMMVSPYFNVADKLYLTMADVREVLAYMAALESKVAALESYLDGPVRQSRSGVPLTRTPERKTT